MLRKIPASKARPGMFVQKLGGSWLDHPFWRASFLLEDADDVKKILGAGIHDLWIDTDRGLDFVETQLPVAGPVAAEADLDLVLAGSDDTKPLSGQSELQAELGRARELYESFRPKIRAMFAEARLGRAIDPEVTKILVDEVATSIHRNPWALISVARFKTSDEYTYMHSVSVCALMVALARQMKLSSEQVRQAGSAGLLHDIGKMRIASEILNKPGKLTAHEFEIVKSHPRHGWDMLRQMPGIDEVALDVCLHHHEKIDGTGYPDGLSGDAISLYARMGAVCDIYDAVTSNRPYKRGWTPAEALRNMARWTDSHLDANVFGVFVKSLGIYPIGSLVRLQSGRLGVVIEQSERSLLTPRVRTFFSASSRVYVQPEVVDLALPDCQDRIISPESSERWGIADMDKYWQ